MPRTTRRRAAAEEEQGQQQAAPQPASQHSKRARLLRSASASASPGSLTTRPPARDDAQEREQEQRSSSGSDAGPPRPRARRAAASLSRSLSRLLDTAAVGLEQATAESEVSSGSGEWSRSARGSAMFPRLRAQQRLEDYLREGADEEEAKQQEEQAEQEEAADEARASSSLSAALRRSAAPDADADAEAEAGVEASGRWERDADASGRLRAWLDEEAEPEPQQVSQGRDDHMALPKEEEEEVEDAVELFESPALQRVMRAVASVSRGTAFPFQFYHSLLRDTVFFDPDRPQHGVVLSLAGVGGGLRLHLETHPRMTAAAAAAATTEQDSKEDRRQPAALVISSLYLVDASAPLNRAAGDDTLLERLLPVSCDRLGYSAYAPSLRHRNVTQLKTHLKHLSDDMRAVQHIEELDLELAATPHC